MVKLAGLSDGIESGGAEGPRGVKYSQIHSECLLMSLAQCQEALHHPPGVSVEEIPRAALGA